MKKYYLFGLIMSLCNVASVAQKLSTSAIDVEASSNIEIVLANEAADNAVALQLSMALPQGFEVSVASISKGSAMEGHDMEWRRTKDNTYLFVFYNLNNTPLPDGELLRIPVKACEQAGTYQCEVQSVRSSNAESVGKDAQSLTFDITVTEPEGIISTEISNLNSQNSKIYDLQGRAHTHSSHSPLTPQIYIINGKKILVK